MWASVNAVIIGVTADCVIYGRMQALCFQKAILRLSPQTISHSSYGLCQPT